MWSIQGGKNESTSYNLLSGENYIVGRKNSHILLGDDPSISRRHALLTVTHPEENLTDPSKISVLKLKDESSKYGTFLNDLRFAANEEKELKDGDIVKFGQFSNIFKISLTPLVITTSCVTPQLKNELKKIIIKLGGHIIPEWRTSCTHLLMSDVKVTVKALCCLLALRPLITPEYLVELFKSFTQRSALPALENFVPPIGEPLIDKEKAVFSVVQTRNSIFRDRTFVFFDDKQMKRLHLAITISGARAVLLSIDGPLDISLLTDPNTCVIQPFGDKMEDAVFGAFVKKVAVALQRRKKRLVPESDFGLAVAYCSTEKFCNPDFNVGNNLLSTPKIASQTLSNAEVYVPDTDEHDRSMRRERLQKLRSAEDKVNQPSTSANTSVNRTIQESEEITTNKRKNYDIFEKLAKRKRMNDDTSSGSDTKSSSEVVTRESSSEGARVKIEPVSRHASQEVISANGTVDIANTQHFTDITLKTDCPPPTLGLKDPLPGMSFTASTVQDNKTSGFHGTNKSEGVVATENGESTEEELPKNLMKITMVDLIKRPAPHPAVSSSDDTVVNFKKFRKASHAGSQSLPRIIGGRDLVRHSDATTMRAMDDWIRDNAVEEPVNSIDECGEFDWDFQSNGQRARGR